MDKPLSQGCPDPAHRGARVVRHGSYGKAGRLRYRCQPSNGEPAHTFSVLPDPPAELDYPQAASRLRSYRHDVHTIAVALHAIARGSSYRQAAILASGGELTNGQTVANWVRRFGPLVDRSVRQPWPPAVRLGTLALRSVGEHSDVVLLLAVGCQPDGRHFLDAVPATTASQPAWLDFLRSHPGIPDEVVVEPASSARPAATLAWPDPTPMLISPAAAASHLDVVGHVALAPSAAELYSRYRGELYRRLMDRQPHFGCADQLRPHVALMTLELSGLGSIDWFAEQVGAQAVPT